MIVRGGANSSRKDRRGGRGRAAHHHHTNSADRVGRRPPLYPQNIQDTPTSYMQGLQDASSHHHRQNETTNIANDTTDPINVLDNVPSVDQIPEISPSSSTSSRRRRLNQGTPEPADRLTR